MYILRAKTMKVDEISEKKSKITVSKDFLIFAKH